MTALGTVVWDPAAGDSAVFALDSATVAAWSAVTDPTVGTHVALLDPGSRLRMSGAALRLDVRPSINPDTIVEVTSFVGDVTFLPSVDPVPPGGEIRIGGAPAWRTILDIMMPEVLNGPPEFCAVVPCPHTIRPVQISFASLVLTSRASDPAFQPTDSIRLDIRPVFDRSAMPKAPLGNSLIDGIGGRLAPAEAFSSAPGFEVQLPFTTFARDLLRGVDDAGNPVPGTLALLSVIEPFSIGFGSFDGPGTPGEPVLRLVLTIGPPVELP